ncbi:DUF397 domain-containing protein [Actinophytocola sp.]|uniref:DUF397 domain-containing protein n=1 Tax=Actinophytocola sp. TaxID=1872138 RepID=UPI002ED126AB
MINRLPTWRKSSYSHNAAGCVELAILDHASWRKASHSDNAAGCVELAVVDEAAAVRDSKHPGGPVLAFSAPSLRAFLSAAGTERFRMP